MQTNLIHSYIQNRNVNPQVSQPKSSDEIEIITRRKAKPKFDINRELANRTFIKPLPPKGHIIKNGIMSAPAVFVDDMAYDLKALKAAWKGDANDHQLGKLNDLGMKLGGLGIAAYLYSIKKTPVKKGMEFVGLASFFASMAIWPKIALEYPARLIHGFNPFMRYEDSQGRKKPFFQDNQYLAYDMISDKEITRVGNRTRIPKDLPNRRDAVQEKMRQIALQNNTMWMLTAGFATPVLSSLICNRLEPYVEDVYGYFMNRKVDNILVDFSKSQKEYASKNIENDVNGVFEMYKGRAINDEILESLSSALTQDLTPKVQSAMKADLTRLFVSGEYRISKLQIKPLVKSMEDAVKHVPGGEVLVQNIHKIVPNDEQLNFVFEKYDGQQFKLNDLKKVSDEVLSVVEKNLTNLNKDGVKISKNTHKNLVKLLSGVSGSDGPLMSVLTNTPTDVLDDNMQNVVKRLAARMSAFCAENNALSVYAFKKLASAPDTSKGKFWNDVAKSLINTLKITPEEIENTRYDRNMVADLLHTKMQKIAADKTLYEDAIKSAAAQFAQIGRHVNPDDMTGKYIKQLETSYYAAAGDISAMGFGKTAEKLIGKNGCEVGSLLGLSRTFVNDNLSNVKNTFARFFNTLNFYRTVINDPDLKVVNNVYEMNSDRVVGKIMPENILKEVKEEIFALGEFLTTSGRISDYSVKFEFLRNLDPNTKDSGPLTFNPDGSVKFDYYNKEKLAKEGVFIPSDTNFFKRVMNLLYGGPVQPETESALTEYSTVKNMLNDFRRNMMSKVGDHEYFALPSKVVQDMWHNGQRAYSGASPSEKSLCVGAALDEMIANTAKQAFNTRKWVKMFGGFFAGLYGVTVLSQFFFGGKKNYYKKDKV